MLSSKKPSTSLVSVFPRLAQSSVGVVIYAILIGVIVAIIADYYEIAFRYLADFWHSNNVFFSHLPNGVGNFIGTLIACPILYFIISQITEKRQHNPADLITGIHINNGKIDTKAALLSALASIFSIGFGFSVGYYAPIVVLGAGVGFMLHRLNWFSPTYYYISVGAGSAAAIAAIFHAPIGAVVFVHEVLFRFFSIRAFAPITIAAVTSYVVSSEFFNKVTFLYVPTQYVANTTTYMIAAIAAVLAAIIGTGMIHSIVKLQQFNQKKRISMIKQLLIAAVITAVIITALPQVAGASLQTLQDLMSNNQFTLGLLALIFVFKILATTVAFGFGVPGGIFGPTIVIGAALGGLIAELMTLGFPQFIESEQIIIISTMAAMISAVLGAPIAMILIVMEMTGNFEMVSVVMLAVVIANITAYRVIGTSSFFDIQLKLRGLDIEMGREQLYAEHHSINSLISEDYIAINEATELLVAEQMLLKAQKNVAYIIDDEDNLLGQIRMIDIRYYSQEVEINDDKPATVMTVTHRQIPTIYRASSIWQAMQKMADNPTPFIPVVDGENNPKLLGVIYNNALVAQYLSFIHQLQNQKNVEDK